MKSPMTRLLYLSFFASFLGSALGRSLQEELGGTPEAPFGLSAGLVGVGVLSEEQESVNGASDNSGTSTLLVVAIVLLVLLLLCFCMFLCCVGGYFVLKKNKSSNQKEPVYPSPKSMQVAMGVPLDGYSDEGTLTSRSFD